MVCQGLGRHPFYLFDGIGIIFDMFHVFLKGGQNKCFLYFRGLLYVFMAFSRLKHQRGGHIILACCRGHENIVDSGVGAGAPF